MPEVILETGTGDFSLDAASGGIAALVDVAWQIYMRSRSDKAFIVLMDEPENHLHPSLQRSVLPGLIGAFPDAQFVVSTHNTFVVTSVRDSNVMVLGFRDGLVRSKNWRMLTGPPVQTGCLQVFLECRFLLLSGWRTRWRILLPQLEKRSLRPRFFPMLGSSSVLLVYDTSFLRL